MVAPRWPRFTPRVCSAIAANYLPRVLFCSIDQHDPEINLNLAGQISLALHPEQSGGVIRMYTIERLVDQGWSSEISFKTEFKAFINAPPSAWQRVKPIA